MPRETFAHYLVLPLFVLPCVLAFGRLASPHPLPRAGHGSFVVPAAGGDRPFVRARAACAGGDAPLIPRKVLLGNPARSAPQLSPDGTRLAYLAPSGKGVSNVWIATLGKEGARMVSRDARRGIYAFEWSADGRDILYLQDRDGDENWHLFSLDLGDGQVRDLTPFLGVRAQGVLTSPRRPREVLVGLNLRDRRVSDVHRIDLDTGAVTLEARNPGDVLSWEADEDFVIRACTAFGGEDAHTTVRVRDDARAPWRDLLTVSFGDCSFYGQVNGGTLVAGFAPGGKSLYVVNPLGGDKTRLVEIDLRTGREVREVAADPRCDVEYDAGPAAFRPAVARDPATGKVQAVGFNYARFEWKVADPAVAEHFEALRRAHPGDFRLLSRARGDTLWLVGYFRPDAPAGYYLYDVKRKKTERLFLDFPELLRYTLTCSR